jgi:hypothetical protein
MPTSTVAGSTRGTVDDSPGPGSITVDPDDLEDSIDHAVFIDQGETEKDEQTHLSGK